MKINLKVLSTVVAVSAILSGTAALAGNQPAKTVGTTCDAFAAAYAARVDVGGPLLANGSVMKMNQVSSLVNNLHTLEDYPSYKTPYIVLKGGDVGTLDGFIGLHLPKDGWKYVYHCKPENGVATITFNVTNPAYKGPRVTDPVSFDVVK